MPRLPAPAHPSPPIAQKKSHQRQYHGASLLDDYFWLKDPGYPEVTDQEILSYLEAENHYFETVMGSRQPLTDQIFEELKGRVQEDDEGVPYFDGPYEYQWKFEQGAQYRVWYRRPKGSAEPFSVYFDENKEAEGQEYFKLHDLAISPCGTLLAWSTDTNGSERFTIRIRNLITGEMLGDEITETSGEIVWSSDSQGFAYVIVSKEWRPYRVMVHHLGQSADSVIFEENDNSFFVHISETSSKDWLVIRSADHVTAENHLVPLAALKTEPLCLARRSTGHDYSVDHGWCDHDLSRDGQGLFIIRSNRDHSNFDILAHPVGAPLGQAWSKLEWGSPDRYIRGLQLFADFMVISDRVKGLDTMTIRSKDRHESHQVLFPEEVCECGLGANCDYDTGVVRLTYTSMITPNTIFDYDVMGRHLTERKVQQIPTGYTKDHYQTTRMMITVRDGVQVPVSLVHHQDWQMNSDAPLHLYGYGAYGLGMSPSFSTARLSLLDRGFAYAIAHIRGGDEMGYDWYKAGKLTQRQNTFNDFVDCARGLVKAGFVKAGHITISGGSAGGELMGAVMNQAPELFAGAVLHVPFVDVLNTMLDDSLPLTPIEWPEWGNPIESKDAYDLIKSYCPYSNITAKNYPPQMVTGGLYDPRVTYWEPAKWTAKMRATKKDDNLLVMKINMGAGHGGKSGRYDRLLEIAEEYTFLCMCVGKE